MWIYIQKMKVLSIFCIYRILWALYFWTFFMKMHVISLCEYTNIYDTKCENTGPLRIQCAHNRGLERSRIMILNGNWGRTISESEGVCAVTASEGIEYQESVSCEFGQDKIVHACEGQRSCRLQSETAWFGFDPCPGTSKYINVTYQCVCHEWRLNGQFCNPDLDQCLENSTCDADSLICKCKPGFITDSPELCTSLQSIVTAYTAVSNGLVVINNEVQIILLVYPYTFSHGHSFCCVIVQYGDGIQENLKLSSISSSPISQISSIADWFNIDSVSGTLPSENEVIGYWLLRHTYTQVGAFEVLFKAVIDDGELIITTNITASAVIDDTVNTSEILQNLRQTESSLIDEVTSEIVHQSHLLEDTSDILQNIREIESSSFDEVASEIVNQRILSTQCTVTLNGLGVTYTERLVFTSRSKVVFQSFTNCSSEINNIAFSWNLYSSENGEECLTTNCLVDMPQHIKTNKARLKLRKLEKKIPFGTFTLHFKVVITTEVDEVTYSKNGWIEFVPLGLKAKISGGNAKTIGINSIIHLDASSSTDPNMDPNDLVFTWLCKKQGEDFPSTDSITSYRNSARTGCLGSGIVLNGRQAVLKLSAHDLVFETLPHTYRFRVYVGKTGKTTVFAQKDITLSSGNPPELDIVCVSNCEEKHKQRTSLKLKSRCNNCGRNERITYLWDIKDNEDTIVDAADTLTGLNQKNLVVKPGVLNSLTETQVKITVTVTKSDGTIGSTSYNVITNSPPVGGSCLVTPTQGSVLDTRFVVDCDNFEDLDTPLTYKVWTKIGKQDRLLTHSQTSTSQSLFLPVGKASQNFEVQLIVEVADAFDASTKVNVTAIVRTPDIDLSELAHHSSGNSSQLNQLINSGDVEGATQLIGSLTSILNTEMEDSGSSSSENVTLVKSQMRTDLVVSLAQVSLPSDFEEFQAESTEDVDEAVSILSEVTSVTTELSDETVTVATDVVLKISQFLNNGSSDLSSEEIEGLGGNLVSVVSNIMESDIMKDTITPTDQSFEVKRMVALSAITAVDEVKSAILGAKIPGEAPTVLSTPSLTVQLSKTYAEDIASAVFEFNSTDVENSKTEIRLPENVPLDLDSNDELDTSVVEYKKNPFIWSNTSNDVTSAVPQLELSCNKTAITVEDLPQPIDIYLPHSSSLMQQGNEDVYNVIRADEAAFIELNYTDSLATVMVEWKVMDGGMTVFTPADMKVYFNVTYNYTDVDNDTNANSALEGVDSIFDQEVPISMLNKVFLPQDVMPSSGMYVIKLKVEDVDSPNISISVKTTQLKCMFWKEVEEKWSTLGCQVGIYSTLSTVHCRCTHLTSFAGGLFIKPNTLNIKEDIAMFKRFWENPIGIIVVCIIVGVYIFLAVWARRKDNFDKIKASFIDVADNNPEAQYKYIVTIYTGTRRGSGTTSHICLMLKGKNGISDPHLLLCNEYKTCQRSDVNFFVIHTFDTLGDINEIRVWHNNSGNHPEWFFSRAIIYDVQKDEKFYFICNSWLAVDLGTGEVDQTFRVATKMDMNLFEPLFFSHVSSGFHDKHLWFSVVNRPAYSRFTRVQRLSCCLSLLLSYMLTNIMFYGIDSEPGEQKMDLGPFTITWTELRIGFQSMLLMVPINMLIVCLFRNIKSRKERDILDEKIMFQKNKLGGDFKKIDRDDPLVYQGQDAIDEKNSNINLKPALKDQANKIFSTDLAIPNVSWNLQDKKHTNSSLGYDLKKVKEPDMYSSMHDPSFLSIHSDTFYSWNSLNDDNISKNVPLKSMNESLLEIPSLSSTDITLNIQSESIVNANTSTKVRRKCNFQMPWWFVIFPWFLVVSVSVTCAFFTILYTFNYGLDKSFKWLRSFISSFVSDIFIQQPLQVVLIALFFSMVIKKTDMEQLPEEPNEERIYSTPDEESIENYKKYIKNSSQESTYQPPAQVSLLESKRHRDTEVRMYNILFEIIRYLIFTYLVLLLAYSQRDTNIFFVNSHTKSSFLSDRHELVVFEDIETVPMLWIWIKDIALRHLYDHHPLSFINGSSLLNEPRLRQFRLKQMWCEQSFSVLGVKCEIGYEKGTEDKTNYCEGWTNFQDQNIFNDSDPWQYRNELQYLPVIGTKEYFGGGYVASLGNNLESANATINHLMNQTWIDDLSAAVVLEFNFYTPNVNLLTTTQILLEFSKYGGIEKSSRIHTFKLYRSTQGFHIFVLIFELTYFVYTVYMIVHEIQTVKRYKFQYFRKVGCIMDFLSCTLSMVIIILYITHLVLISNFRKSFRTNIYKGLEGILFLDDALHIIFSFLLVIVMLKFLHLLRFNPMIYKFMTVFKYASGKFFMAVILMLLLIVAFGHVMFLISGYKLQRFSSMKETFITLFSVSLGQVSIEGLEQVHRILGPSVILFCSCILIYVIFNMMITILIETLDQISKSPQPLEDADLLWLLWYKLVNWLGIKSEKNERTT